MYDYRAELAEINARCDALGITGELLSKTDVGRRSIWKRSTF